MPDAFTEARCRLVALDAPTADLREELKEQLAMDEAQKAGPGQPRTPGSTRNPASPIPHSPAPTAAPAARNSFAASRRQLSGILPGTGKDLGALVRDSRRSLSASGHTLPGAEAGSKGMVLPFTPLNLTFHHLSYYVDLAKVCCSPGRPCWLTCLCICAQAGPHRSLQRLAP